MSNVFWRTSMNGSDYWQIATNATQSTSSGTAVTYTIDYSNYEHGSESRWFEAFYKLSKKKMPLASRVRDLERKL